MFSEYRTPTKAVVLVVATGRTAKLIEYVLGSGFHLVYAKSYQEAADLADRRKPDIALIDEEIEGVDLMLRLKSSFPRMSVIALIHTDSSAQRISLLDIGMDNIVTTPYEPDLLVAVLNSMFKRDALAFGGDGVVSIPGHGILIDLRARTVFRDTERLHLTRTEWRLLEYLSGHAGRVMTNAELLTHTWGPEYVDDLQYLRVWVARLRAKLGDNQLVKAHRVRMDDHSIIRTHPGIGYMFDTGAVL